MSYQCVLNSARENFPRGTVFRIPGLMYSEYPILVIQRQIKGSRYEILRKEDISSPNSILQYWNFDYRPYVDFLVLGKDIEDDLEYKEMFI